MPRIRRGGQRVRGSDGGRSLNEDCCCGEVVANCNECDPPWGVGATFQLEVVGYDTVTLTRSSDCIYTFVDLTKVFTCGEIATASLGFNGGADPGDRIVVGMGHPDYPPVAAWRYVHSGLPCTGEIFNGDLTNYNGTDGLCGGYPSSLPVIITRLT